MTKINNQKNCSNSVKVEVKIVHSNKWWDNKWQVELEKKLDLRELTLISTKNYKNSKQLKLNKSYNLKLVHTLQVWCHLLKIVILTNSSNRIKNKIQVSKNNQKKIMTVVLTGEKENFMMTMTINNIIQSKMNFKTKTVWYLRLVKLKSMKVVVREKTKKEKRKLLCNLILVFKSHWFHKTKTNLL